MPKPAAACADESSCVSPARLAACRQAHHRTLVSIGRSEVCRPPPGNSQCAGLWFESAPMYAQRIQQRRAQHDVAVLAPLATSNVDDHTLAVDVADL